MSMTNMYMQESSDPREYTNHFIDIVDECAVDKDTLVKELLYYLSEDEVIDFARQYSYDELYDGSDMIESWVDLDDEEWDKVEEIVQKYYPQYKDEKYAMAMFLNDVAMNRLPTNCYVELDAEHAMDSKYNDLIELDALDISQGTGNVVLITSISPKDGKLYRYADM